MHEAEFFVPSRDARLFARAVVPHNARTTQSGEVAVFVLSHGLLDNIESPVFAHLQQALSRLALASVAFDFHGNGNSTGTTSYGNYYDEADDIAHVVRHLRQRGIPGAAKPLRVIGLLGHSKGASSMLLFAFKYTHMCPPLIINLSGRFWLAREITMRWTDENQRQLRETGRFLWRRYGRKPTKSNGGGIEGGEGDAKQLVREYWISLDDMKVRATTDMSVVQALPLHRCFALNISGSRDQIVPDDDVWEYDRLMRLAAPSSDRVVTRIVPGAAHFWNKPRELDALERTLRRWLVDVLPRVGL
ncbi:hypothetical protein H4S02_001267 [Coemansia sp. RSA 2611]|nr:hypothetical protein LPJ70_005313 [Coemansia sp. RSA 2708]KAJ2369647.1 hypothetical protein H4S01_000872 [Coemansia sp. RSA 2610]KAJ2391555.1 hypothetical protein H4S02_001267 [Coemansia sp. RSA 2611]